MRAEHATTSTRSRPPSSSAASCAARCGSARSAFVTATTPSRTPSAARTASVLARLRHDAVVGRDDHEKRSMPVAPATIVRTKRSWPGTSTTESRGRRARQRRVAELDRDAARLLLGGQPIGVDAGERRDERGLAVIDVTGSAEGQRRHRARARRTAAAARSASASVSVRTSSSRRPSAKRPTTGGSPLRSAGARAGSTATAGPGSSSQRQRAAADLRRRGDDLAAAALGQPRRRARRARPTWPSSIRRTGSSARARSGSR